ncbi:MAG: type II secretion system secretin GspD [Pseudomonadaceae bacterium]|nr:type II secretion system secretin GspD [Pseudomonadaceae bacterium]
MKTRPFSTIFQAWLLGALLVFCTSASAQEWTINIKNADIHEFVQQVAEITGRTFVIDPRLKGNVTVVSKTPLDGDGVYALFLSVLRVHNFTATESGGVVRIQQQATGKQSPGASGALDNVPPEELVTRVIPAQNVPSDELVKILRPLIPQYGHIAAVSEPNVVIISDHADNILRLSRLIRQIDVSDENEVLVVQLKEAWVGNMVAMLEKVAPEQIGRSAKGPQRIQIIANERNNSMVIRGKPRPVAEVMKLVEMLDKPATTTGATQVLYLSHADATSVADILNEIISDRPAGDDATGGEPTTIKADESLNAIVARADPGTMSEILDIVDKLDVRRTQVLIEAAIVEVTLDDTESLGVEIAAADARGETLPLVSTGSAAGLGNLLNNVLGENETLDIISALAGLTDPTIAAAKIDLNAISFGALITAVANVTDANLLSTPSILTLDNQEAQITVGRTVPFRTGSFTTNTDGASNPFTTIQREDVGLELVVTPHVHDGESVRLEVSQSVEDVIPSNIGDSGFSDVVTSKREIKTTILANDGQTVVLGGLIKDNVTDSVRKVPLLGDVPLLGRLFRSDTQTVTKQNLLVFLRPTVIREPEDADRVTARKYAGVYEVEISSEDAGREIDALFQGVLPDRATADSE